MSKFKVGDNVIGNESATGRYSTTVEGWEGVVARVRSNGAFVAEGPGTCGASIPFDLQDKYFDLVLTKSNPKPTQSSLSNFPKGTQLVLKANFMDITSANCMFAAQQLKDEGVNKTVFTVTKDRSGHDQEWVSVEWKNRNGLTEHNTYAPSQFELYKPTQSSPELPPIYAVKVNPDESRELQEYLFTQGYRWSCHGTKVTYAQAAHLVVDSRDKRLRFSGGNESKRPLVSLRSILPQQPVTPIEEAPVEEVPVKYGVKVNPEESRKLQEYLFTQGYKWINGSTKVLHTDIAYLFIDTANKCLTQDRDACGYLIRSIASIMPVPQTFEELVTENESLAAQIEKLGEQRDKLELEEIDISERIKRKRQFHTDNTVNIKKLMPESIKRFEQYMKG